jgi:hypothetical protein
VRVQLYRNLNKSRDYNVWSLTQAKSKRCGASRGRLYGHGDIVLLEDCCFVVSESGRQRVINRRQKEVHAWVEGELVELVEHPSNAEPDLMPDDVYDGRWIGITYNPYRGPDFVRRDTGRVIGRADFVAATPSGIMAAGLSGLRGYALGALPEEHAYFWNG